MGPFISSVKRARAQVISLTYYMIYDARTCPPDTIDFFSGYIISQVHCMCVCIYKYKQLQILGTDIRYSRLQHVANHVWICASVYAKRANYLLCLIKLQFMFTCALTQHMCECQAIRSNDRKTAANIYSDGKFMFESRSAGVITGRIYCEDEQKCRKKMFHIKSSIQQTMQSGNGRWRITHFRRPAKKTIHSLNTVSAQHRPLIKLSEHTQFM